MKKKQNKLDPWFQETFVKIAKLRNFSGEMNENLIYNHKVALNWNGIIFMYIRYFVYI